MFTDRFFAFLGLFIAIVIVSFAAIFTKISEQELSANATIFDRYSIALIVLVIAQGVGTIVQRIQWRRNWETETFEVRPFEAVWQRQYERRDIYLFLGEGVLGLSCVWLWAISLTQTSVANSNLLHNLTPIFTALGGILFFKESLDRRFLLGLGFALIATLGLQWQDWQLSPTYLWGDLLALLSAVFYAAGFLVREKLRQKFSTSTVLFWNCVCRSFLALMIILAIGDEIVPLSRSGWIAVLGLGVLVQLLGHGLLTYSLKHLSASFATLCLLLDPIITAILAWISFGEQLNFTHGIAFLGVLFGIYLAATSSRSLQPAQIEDS
ncbi:MAG: DMT family transporter [Prochlorotrichaceae cyanobacterium]